MKKLLLLAALLPALAFGHGAPVIWNGTSAKWLPSGLNSAGVCKLSAAGVMSSSTVSDGELATSYVKADGTRALSGAWNAGQNITAPSFIGALTGNASTATALASNPSDCGAGTKATSIDASGNLTCSAVSLTADVSGTLPVTNGGTGTATQFTVGSVIFAGASGVYAQDNASLFFDDSNNRLGIGTSSPSYRFHFRAAADDYSHGLAFDHALGGANSLWRLYPDLNGTIGLYNPAQGTAVFSITATEQQLKLAEGGADGGAVNIRNHTGKTAHHTLVLKKLASQTGDALRYYDTDGSTVLAKVDVSGAAIFNGVTSSLTGNASTASALAANPSDCASDRYATTIEANGNLTCAQVNAAAGVTGTLPVANGGTGQTSYTDGQLLIGNSSGNTLTKSTLTAGSNITITNGGGSITIASSGGSSSLSQVKVKTSDYTMTNSDDVVLCNTTTSMNVTMHSAASATTKSYKIKNIGTAECTVLTNDKFDYAVGETSISIPAGGLPTSGIELIPDSGGPSWLIF